MGVKFLAQRHSAMTILQNSSTLTIRPLTVHAYMNSKVSFQVIPAALEAIKDAEYEGTYIRPVSIQYVFFFLIKTYFAKVTCMSSK